MEYSIVFLCTLALFLFLVPRTAPAPALILPLSVWLLGGMLVELAIAIRFRRVATLELVTDREGRTRRLSSSAYRMDRALFLLMLTCAVVLTTLSATWLGLRASGWKGVYGVELLKPGQHVAVGETGASVDVQAGWNGDKSSQLRVPAALGLWDSPEHQSTVSVTNPAQDDGYVSIYYGSKRNSWSNLKRAKTLRHIAPDTALRSAGVRSIVVNRASGGSGAASAAWLFVDNPAGRYIITVHVTDGPHEVDLNDVATALANAGVSLATE